MLHITLNTFYFYILCFVGYQRQQKFRHSDGSFSAFGELDKEGSTWVTAFVLKSLAHARPYTTVDEAALEKTSEWLKALQMPDGCFESRGRVITKNLQVSFGRVEPSSD